MARKWLIGIGLTVLVVGALFLTGIIPIGDSNAAYMEITFYDADGNELGKADDSLSIFGIQSPEFTGDIYSLDVVVYFDVTTDMDYTIMTSKCLLSVKTEVNTLSPTRMGVVHTIAEHQLGATNSDESGSFYATYLMSTLLPDSKIDADKDIGWKMYFNAKVTTTVGLDGYDSEVVEETCGTTLILTWVESTLVLEAWFGDW